MRSVIAKVLYLRVMHNICKSLLRNNRELLATSEVLINEIVTNIMVVAKRLTHLTHI